MTRSDDDPLPPLAVALTALRVRASCRQSRLADELGISGTRLSLFENGHRDLKRERLEELLAPLGWGPEDIDFTLFWYDALSPEALDGIEPPGSPFGLDEAERRAFRHVATAAGRAGFSAALAAAARNRRRALSRQARVRARAAWKRLSRSLGEERRWLVERAEEYRDFALCDLLCEESERAAARDASQAIELAELALHIAERVPGSDTWRARLQGYAWAFLANALRVDNDLDAADLAFAVARALWESGAEADSGVLDPSRILDLEASLRRAQRRWPEALGLLGRAVEVCPHPEGLGRILLKKAFTHEQMGDYEDAAAALEQAAPLIEGHRDRRLTWVHRLNLGVNLCHLGRHSEALSLVTETRELALALRNDLDLLRVLWLDARVAAGLGRREEATAKIRQVRADFAHRDMPYDTALATLDLVILLLEENENAEAQTLALEMVAVFKRLAVYREALAAVHLFRRAAEQEAATAELGRRLLRFLERARYDPELRFEMALQGRRTTSR
jgi:tetratricopeptide (TPR) repeat protein